MKVHYVILGDKKTLCGKNIKHLDYVNGPDAIHKVNCVVCINSLVANLNVGGDKLVERIKYDQIVSIKS